MVESISGASFHFDRDSGPNISFENRMEIRLCLHPSLIYSRLTSKYRDYLILYRFTSVEDILDLILLPYVCVILSWASILRSQFQRRFKLVEEIKTNLIIATLHSF